MMVTPITVNAAMTDDNFSYMSEYEDGTANHISKIRLIW